MFELTTIEQYPGEQGRLAVDVVLRLLGEDADGRPAARLGRAAADAPGRARARRARRADRRRSAAADAASGCGVDRLRPRRRPRSPPPRSTRGLGRAVDPARAPGDRTSTTSSATSTEPAAGEVRRLGRDEVRELGRRGRGDGAAEEAHRRVGARRDGALQVGRLHDALGEHGVEHAEHESADDDADDEHGRVVDRRTPAAARSSGEQRQRDPAARGCAASVRVSSGATQTERDRERDAPPEEREAEPDARRSRAGTASTRAARRSRCCRTGRRRRARASAGLARGRGTARTARRLGAAASAGSCRRRNTTIAMKPIAMSAAVPKNGPRQLRWPRSPPRSGPMAMPRPSAAS